MLSDIEYKSSLDEKLEDFIKETEVLEMYKDYAWELINQGVFDGIDPNVAFEWMRRRHKFISTYDYNKVDRVMLYICSVYENDNGCILDLGKWTS